MKRATGLQAASVVLARCFPFSFGTRSVAAAEKSANQANKGSIPVIFDTDIGNDIDDTWALILLLKCP
ncbi:unnamed protein product, partial [marine sediment metagenome]